MHLLPGVVVLERGWLSANSILFLGTDRTAIVDTGYWTHAEQTAALVARSLTDRPLDLILNTHLHSDHCGGNSMLQDRYPLVETFVPPGSIRAVQDWDPVALTYVPTGQHCPRFRADGVVRPGTFWTLAGREWQVHAAPGHDPHSVILFEPASRTLISADALWRNGFGVVFPELDGVGAFEEVAATLDLIEGLQPKTVIPGHGAVFSEVAQALDLARSRLGAYVRDPARHASHGARVLLKFHLLEVHRTTNAELAAWVSRTPYFGQVHARYFRDREFGSWVLGLAGDLVRSGAAIRADGALLNA